MLKRLRLDVSTIKKVITAFHRMLMRDPAYERGQVKWALKVDADIYRPIMLLLNIFCICSIAFTCPVSCLKLCVVFLLL